MKVRPVLLDTGLIAAIVNTQGARHLEAATLYRTLLQGYAAGTDRLFALSTALADLAEGTRHSTLAPVIALTVARRHRSAARNVRADVDPDTASTLVMLATEKIRTVATLASAFDHFDLDIIRGSVAAPATDSVAAAQ